MRHGGRKEEDLVNFQKEEGVGRRADERERGREREIEDKEPEGGGE